MADPASESDAPACLAQRRFRASDESIVLNIINTARPNVSAEFEINRRSAALTDIVLLVSNLIASLCVFTCAKFSSP